MSWHLDPSELIHSLGYFHNVSFHSLKGELDRFKIFPRLFSESEVNPDNPPADLQCFCVLALPIRFQQRNILLIQCLDLLLLLVHLLHLVRNVGRIPLGGNVTFLWSAPKWSLPIFCL